MRRLAFVSVPILGGILLSSILILRRSKDEIPFQRIPPVPQVTSVARKPEALPPKPEPQRDVESEARIFFKSGLEKAERGDPKGAIADYDQAISLKKDWGEAYYNRAVVKTTLKEYSGAVLDYDRMIHLKGGGAEAYYSRACAKLALGRHQEAVLDFNQAIARREDWPEAFYNRGLTRESLLDYRGAEKDYLHALKIAPPAWPSRGTLEERIAIVRQKP
jgi:tetratricopeptide (TPR) repeat protein